MVAKLGLLLGVACALPQAWAWRPGAAWRIADRLGFDRSDLVDARCAWDEGPLLDLTGFETKGEGWSMSSPSIRVEPALMPLILGVLRPDHLTLESPEIEIDPALLRSLASLDLRSDDTISLALSEARLRVFWKERCIAKTGPWSGRGMLSRSRVSLENLRAPDLSLRNIAFEPEGVRLDGLELKDGRVDAWLLGELGALSWSGSSGGAPFSGRAALARTQTGWIADSLSLAAHGGRWNVWAERSGEEALRYRANLVAPSQPSIAASMADLWTLLSSTPIPLEIRVDVAPCSLDSGQLWGPLWAEGVADGRGGSKGSGRGPGLGLEWSWPAEGEAGARCELDRVPLEGIGPIEGLVSGRLSAGTARDAPATIEGELFVSEGRVRSASLDRAAQRAMPIRALRGLYFDRIDARTRFELPVANGEATKWGASLTLRAPELELEGRVTAHDTLSGVLVGRFRGEAARELAEIPGLGPVLLDRGGELPGRIVIGGTWDEPFLWWEGAARADSVREAWTRERTRELRRSLEEMLGLDEGGLNDPLEQATVEGVLELYQRRRGGR